MRNNSYVLNLFNTHTVQPKSIASGPNSLHLLISSQFIFGGNSQSRNDRFKRTCDIISTCFSFSLRLMGIDCKLQLWRNSSRRISLQTDTSDVCKDKLPTLVGIHSWVYYSNNCGIFTVWLCDSSLTFCCAPIRPLSRVVLVANTHRYHCLTIFRWE